MALVPSATAAGPWRPLLLLSTAAAAAWAVAVLLPGTVAVSALPVAAAFGVACASCLLRAARCPSERAAWAALGASQAALMVGFASWTILHANVPNPPLSVAQAGWLGGIALMLTGMVLLLRSERGHSRGGTRLDAVIAACAMTALAAQALPPTFPEDEGGLIAKVSVLGYLAGDLGLVALAGTVIALRGGRPSGRWTALAGAVLVYAAGDVLWSVGVADGSFHVGSPIDLCWMLAGVLVAWAPWLPATSDDRARSRAPLMPALSALLALALLVYGALTGELVLLALALSVVALVAGGVRSFMAVRAEERARALDAMALELAERAARQAALAGIGREAVASADAAATFGRACQVVAATLGVRWAAVLEHGAGGPQLRAVWPEGVPHVDLDEPGAISASVARRDGEWGLIAAGPRGPSTSRDSGAGLPDPAGGGVERAADRHFLQAMAAVVSAVVGREAEDALEHQLEQSRRLESVGQLAGGVAHDFNNLLAVILNYGAFAREVAVDAEQRQDLDELIGAARRAADLVRQLLQFSRRESVAHEPLDINLVIRDALPMLRRTVEENVRIRQHLEDGLPPVLGDEGELVQVLVNLVVNARDALPDGGTVTIATDRAGDGVRLTVADTGSGLDPAIAARAFDPFFTTKDAGSGTGLGLATVYGIVTGMGGDVALDSRPGQGAVVTILLPAAAGSPAIRSETPPPARKVSDGAGRTVLLVEDEEPVRRLTARILKGAGFRVLEAPDGETALSMAEREGARLDVVVSDLVMPGMGGAELARRLRELQPDLPVLHMSGYAQPHDLPAEDAVAIAKPFTAVGLLTALDEALTRAENAVRRRP